MNSVDLALVAVFAAFALRGFWRGFFRESFGLLALCGGLAAAMHFTAAGAAALEPYLTTAMIREGLAFVGIFAVTHTSVNVMGALLDRWAGAPSLGSLNRIAGSAVGAGKGGALLAVVLLFLHLFPLVPTLDARFMESRLAPPLVELAGNVIRFGLGPDASTEREARS